LDGPGIDPVGRQIFGTDPDLHWGPYDAHRVFFPRVKRPDSGVNHPPPPSAKVKERVELHLCFPYEPS
jgi:hypothetical protein